LTKVLLNVIFEWISKKLKKRFCQVIHDFVKLKERENFVQFCFDLGMSEYSSEVFASLTVF
jgi:hypothetical protein